MTIVMVVIIFITVLHFALKYTPEKKLNDISDKIIKEENKISPEQQTSLEKIDKMIKERTLYDYRYNPVLKVQTNEASIKYLPERPIERSYMPNGYPENNVYMILGKSSYGIDQRTFDITLDDQYYDYLHEDVYHGPTLSDIPDDERFERRIILNRINASIKFPMFSDVYINEEFDSAISYTFIEPDSRKKRMFISSLIPDSIAGDKFYYDLTIQEYIENMKSVPEISNVIDEWNMFSKTSHYFAISGNHKENYNIGIVKDLNNVFTTVILYNSSEEILIDTLNSMEFFNSNGFRYINSPYRDKIYVDNINSVF